MASCWKTVASGLLGLALAATAGASYAAPPKPPGRAELVKELSACRAITDSTERLACFDKTAAALDEAQNKGEVVVVDRRQVQEVKREAFGFNLNSLSVFNKSGAKEAEDDSITALAKSAFQNATGKWAGTNHWDYSPPADHRKWGMISRPYVRSSERWSSGSTTPMYRQT